MQESPHDEEQTAWERGAEWISRTFAVVGVIVVPGIIGQQLDKYFETSLLTPAGFLFGLACGLTGLVVLARKFTPPARGEPIPWPEDDDGNEDVSEE